MTYKEALKRFEKIAQKMSDAYYHLEKGGKTDEEYENDLKALDMIADGAKKQVAMRGIPYNSAKNHKSIECPLCHKDMDLYYGYCHYCGQKVDWSEEE